MKPDLSVDPDLVLKTPYPKDKVGAYVLNDEKDSIQIITYKSKNKNEIDAKVWFGPQTAGPPGHVHGGCQAAVLDEMMGTVGWYLGYKVAAARIEVNFFNMVPICHTYKMNSKVIKVERRKVFVEAQLFDDTKIYSKSAGIFVQLSDETIKNLDSRLGD